MKYPMTLLIALFTALLLAINTMFIVNEREMAVVTQFQRLVGTEEQAGLKFKLPFLQRVEYFDGRMQRLDVEPEMFMTNEKKWLLVDYFVQWRIKDLRTFYTSVQGSFDRANTLLDQLVKEGLRGEFVKYSVKQTLAEGRGSIMDNITAQLQREALQRYGIEIVGVRLKRIDFSDDIRDHVFERMRAERERVSKSLRAQGEEKSQIIRATAEREAAEMLAQAQQDALIVRGQADAAAAEIYSQAYGQDLEFYKFWRSMASYQQSLANGEKSTLLLSPHGQYFRYLNGSELAPVSPTATPTATGQPEPAASEEAAR